VAGLFIALIPVLTCYQKMDAPDSPSGALLLLITRSAQKYSPTLDIRLEANKRWHFQAENLAYHVRA